MIIAGTGHRPDKLPASHEELVAFARSQVQGIGATKVISGMAQGWDQALAQAALELGLPYVAAVPFAGYGKRYCADALYRFMWLTAMAGEIHIISDFPGARALQNRNEWMVDRAECVLALHDGSWGGTFNCVQYARKRGVRVVNCWDALSDPEILV